MTQMVEFVTHTKGNTLDLVLTNIPERITDVQDVGRLGRSDHVMIMTKVSVKKEQKTEREGLPDWRKADWDSMRKSLGKEDWRLLLQGTSVD